MSIGINGIGGAAPFDRETFGAAVATETLNALNNAGDTAALAPVDRESAEASLVSKTLDSNNSGSSGNLSGAAVSFDFQTSVLGAHATGALLSETI